MTKDEECIEDVLDGFNFHKVANIMAVVGWGWIDNEDNFFIPEVKDLRKRARELLTDAAKYRTPEGYRCACGGFEACADSYDDGTFFLSLRFILEEESSYVD